MPMHVKHLLVQSIPIKMYTIWATSYYGDIFPYRTGLLSHTTSGHILILIPDYIGIW